MAPSLQLAQIRVEEGRKEGGATPEQKQREEKKYTGGKGQGKHGHDHGSPAGPGHVVYLMAGSDDDVMDTVTEDLEEGRPSAQPSHPA